jgi:hypothetical protein
MSGRAAKKLGLPDGPKGLRQRPLVLMKPTDIDEEAAQALLEPYIVEVAARFYEAGLTRLEGIKIRVSASEGGEGRNFAACRTDGRLIVLSPDMVHLVPATLTAILAHELGHAADFLYPGLFVPGRDGRMILLDDSKKGVPTGEAPVPKTWLSDWRARDIDAQERQADRIAETVLGVRIGYSGPCLLQTIDDGISPRPHGLR